MRTKIFTNRFNSLIQDAEDKLKNLIELYGEESEHISDEKCLKINDTEYMFNLEGERYLIEITDLYDGNLTLLDNDGYHYTPDVLEVESLIRLVDYFSEQFESEQPKETDLEIQKTLILSTGHLPHKEFLKLENDVLMPFRSVSHEYGCLLIFMDCEDDNENEFVLMRDEYPTLSKIYNLMQVNDIKRVDFDQDGAELKELEKFDW